MTVSRARLERLRDGWLIAVVVYTLLLVLLSFGPPLVILVGTWGMLPCMLATAVALGEFGRPRWRATCVALALLAAYGAYALLFFTRVPIMAVLPTPIHLALLWSGLGIPLLAAGVADRALRRRLAAI